MALQKRSQPGIIAIDPGSKEDVGDVLVAEPGNQHGYDHELYQNDRVENVDETFTIRLHIEGL